MTENNSTRKLDVGFVDKPDGSRWVYVDLLKWGEAGRRPRWIPSFLDLHRIIQAIAICEDEKYPPPNYAGRGRVVSFLRDAVYESNFNQLAKKYQIPERDGDQVVATNGAKLKHPGAPLVAVEAERSVERQCQHKPEYRVNGRCWICERTHHAGTT